MKTKMMLAVLAGTLLLILSTGTALADHDEDGGLDKGPVSFPKEGPVSFPKDGPVSFSDSYESSSDPFLTWVRVPQCIENAKKIKAYLPGFSELLCQDNPYHYGFVL